MATLWDTGPESPIHCTVRRSTTSINLEALNVTSPCSAFLYVYVFGSGRASIKGFMNEATRFAYWCRTALASHLYAEIIVRSSKIRSIHLIIKQTSSSIQSTHRLRNRHFNCDIIEFFFLCCRVLFSFLFKY